MLGGWALWLTLIVSAYGIDASERFAPQWVKRADIPDTLASVMIIAALPVEYGGYFLVWGEGGPPDSLKGWPFNTLVGLVLYGALGVIAAAIYVQSKRRNEKRANPP